MVLGYLEAAAEVESHWGSGSPRSSAASTPPRCSSRQPPAASASSSPGDAEWPTQLAALRAAGALNYRGGEPVGLWVPGSHDLRHLAGNAVAIVGSRAATSHGTEQSTELSRDLAMMGHAVISGAAFGVDRPYPDAHAQLLDAIAERGMVVSEAPPGAGPTRSRFLARQRITAGLADGTVVVEGGVRSGALNTARWTTNLHRPLMGVPGPVSSSASTGINQLIASAPPAR